MTTIFRLFFLISISVSTAFGQTQKLILTEKQNNKWLDITKTSTLDQQLILIKDRLVADTNIFVRKSYNDGIRVIDQIGNRIYGYGKPSFFVGGYLMIIDNKTETSKIIQLTKLLTNELIKSIDILSPNDPATTAIYGSAGMSGIIVIGLTKKKYLKKFRGLNLSAHY